MNKKLNNKKTFCPFTKESCRIECKFYYPLAKYKSYEINCLIETSAFLYIVNNKEILDELEKIKHD